MPAKITAIEPQQKNPQRVNIYLDGEFAFGLAKIVAAWLKVGQELDEARIASLKAEDERETAYQKALRFLSYRPRSSAEVRRNLTRRGLAADLVEATIARLQENGLLDDGQFARLWVENRGAFRPRSHAALKMELRKKGLDEQAIQSALEAEAEDEEQLARLAARKQARRYAGLEWPEFRRKLGAFLARRGFSYTTFAPALSEIWREMHPMAESGDTLNNEE